MELDTKKKTSQALLSCGSGGGLGEKLLLKPQAARSLQTERIPRSSVMDKLQNFLPQMAEANEKLKQQIEEGAAGYLDIENVEEAERVIEMDVALVELDGSDGDEETSDPEEDSDSEDEDVGITEQNLKLPGEKSRRKDVRIQVLE
ncbi:uncharacterized protein C12orf45 homolog [Cololabis saira]|uniref:uncharacterized protein C12orf45 homolog n=1 Tax=Cololabis saira TaxID=129043 RepID=UPI002AD3055E|nr:uncharacterized protein C12orf45 homolog [Cololabis saira]